MYDFTPRSFGSALPCRRRGPNHSSCSVADTSTGSQRPCLRFSHPAAACSGDPADPTSSPHSHNDRVQPPTHRHRSCRIGITCLRHPYCQPCHPVGLQACGPYGPLQFRTAGFRISIYQPHHGTPGCPPSYNLPSACGGHAAHRHGPHHTHVLSRPVEWHICPQHVGHHGGQADGHRCSDGHPSPSLSRTDHP